ncbi:MAG: succinate dehydrogenase [Gammaproteobacteria bacterium]|nr:MAG: succinate dehydrogenase [Gammaproteobacteria bacterium]
MVLQLKKRTMALAGVIMTGYLIFHMLSNLSFLSESSFNQLYAFYHSSGLRWLVLALMVIAIGIHVKIAIQIRTVNAKARRIDYARHDKFKIPALFVTLSIIFLLSFIVIHIVQTLLFDSAQLYSELSQLFKSEFMLLFYLAGLFVLTMHLQHSLANVLQTLGKTSVIHHALVWGGVLSLTGGFALIPLYIYFVMP